MPCFMNVGDRVAVTLAKSYDSNEIEICEAIITENLGDDCYLVKFPDGQEMVLTDDDMFPYE